MASIKSTITLTANKSAATSNPGPLSVALALSATELLTVDNVQTEIVTPPISTDSPDDPLKILDGSALTGTGFTGGTHGGYIYMKNITSSGSNLIYVGVVAAGGSDAPTEPVDMGDGTTALDTADDASLRTFTLKPGEFAFFPWDYLGDIFCGANAASQSLEYWLFDRG